jgi:hypothetical protein
LEDWGNLLGGEHSKHALLELGYMLKRLIDEPEGLVNQHSVVGGFEELQKNVK